MTFDQLEIVEMIVEKGSFKAAARHLNRTQPTLSVAIKKLEAEFDLQIFSRESYRPSLTEEGRLFYKRAKECLDSFRHLALMGKELGTQKVEPKLVFVVDPLVSFDVLALIFHRCLGTMKPTELIFRGEILCRGEELLRAGQADFALAAWNEPKTDIDSIPLERIEMIPVVARSLAAEDAIDSSWLKEHPQIVAMSTPESVSGLGDSFGVMEAGRPCYVTDHALKRRMIEAGFGWGRLARHEVQAQLKSGELYVIKNKALPKLSLHLHLMRHRLRPMGPIAHNVWTHMQEIASKG
jgi:DNA-binding transcriptional LysR family regulator